MVEFGTSSAFRGWVRVRVLDYGSGVRGIKVKSRDCVLASDLVRAKFGLQLYVVHCREARVAAISIYRSTSSVSGKLRAARETQSPGVARSVFNF